MKSGLCILIALMTVLSFGPARSAEVETNVTRMGLVGDAADVWAAVDKQWGRSGCCGREDLTENSRWLDLLTDDAKVWFYNQAAPLDKEGLRMWEQSQKAFDHHKRIAYELYPQGLVVHGNVAVAHYRFSVAKVQENGELKRGGGKFTDILVREQAGGQWKLLSWVGHPGDE